MLDRDIDPDDDYYDYYREEYYEQYEEGDYDEWKKEQEPTDYEMDIAQCKWDDEIWRGGEY